MGTNGNARELLLKPPPLYYVMFVPNLISFDRTPVLVNVDDLVAVVSQLAIIHHACAQTFILCSVRTRNHGHVCGVQSLRHIAAVAKSLFRRHCGSSSNCSASHLSSAMLKRVHSLQLKRPRRARASATMLAAIQKHVATTVAQEDDRIIQEVCDYLLLAATQRPSNSCAHCVAIRLLRGHLVAERSLVIPKTRTRINLLADLLCGGMSGGRPRTALGLL